jgi:hypothetical protein
VGTLGTRNAVTRYRNTYHADVIERVVAAVRAYNGFATSLEVVVLGILHGVDASFDTATDGLHGIAHIEAYGAGAAMSKGHRERSPLRM